MSQSTVQFDPLNSPHPVPWNWVMTTLFEPCTEVTPKIHHYRSQSIVSPDGQFAAYSRIQVQVQPDFTQSRVSSVLFLENLRTGSLQTITASSPLSDNPLVPKDEPDMLGTIAILIPVGWSEKGDRLLAREFESIFGSDFASDYAVIWDSCLNRISTLAPTQIQYTNAVILGWSQTYPNRVLFRAGNLGDPDWLLWAVDNSGQTVPATDDRPIVFGRAVNSIWTGPR
jgi:hypothetical protein